MLVRGCVRVVAGLLGRGVGVGMGVRCGALYGAVVGDVWVGVCVCWVGVGGCEVVFHRGGSVSDRGGKLATPSINLCHYIRFDTASGGVSF